MERAVIGMGTNLGDRERNLLDAAAWLEDSAGVDLLGLSPVYETDPLGPARYPFLNAAALVMTDLEPPSLLALCAEGERRAGRPADHEKWGPRVLDLDILVMGDRVIEAAPPLLPHPGLLARDFALRPLVDIEEGAVHPLSGEPLALALRRIDARTITSGPHPLPRDLGYRVLEHTADAGLEVAAGSLPALLEVAAMALADAIVPRTMLRERTRHGVSLEAPELETLLVALLQEVIFLLETRLFLPVRVRVRELIEGDVYRLEASLFGSSCEPAWIRMPVKAATHHDLRVGRSDRGGWTARVFVDV